MELKVLPYIRALAAEHRVLVLGGHAMIFHGMERATEDSDVWLDSTGDLEAWCRTLTQLVEKDPNAYFWDLAARRRVEASEVPKIVDAYGVIRIGGLEEPLDVFRRPNNFKEGEFVEAWSSAAPVPQEEARVFSSLDLIVSKSDSERQKDISDIAFLEGKVRAEFAPILRTCTAAEARALFNRYTDHETCRAALANPDPEVHALAVETLRELAAGQNPFAREMLAELGLSEN